jgi:hypothetical protein
MYLSLGRLLRHLRLGRDARTVDESQWPADGGHPRWGLEQEKRSAAIAMPEQSPGGYIGHSPLGWCGIYSAIKRGTKIP